MSKVIRLETGEGEAFELLRVISSEGRLKPPFEVRLFALLLFVGIYNTSLILVAGILMNPANPEAVPQLIGDVAEGG